MAEKINIASGSLIDAATLETSETLAANYPLDNLLTLQPGEKTRFTDPASVSVDIDFGAATAIDFVALIAHNGSATGTIQLVGADTQGGLASPPVDSGAVSLYPASGKPDADVQHSFVSIASASRRWWRVIVDDTGNADGYFEAGRLMLTSAWAPEVNFSFGAGIGWLDPSPVDQGVDGHLFPLRRSKHRAFTLRFEYGTEADMLGGLYEIQRLRGASDDVFVVMDKDDTTHLHRRMLHGLMVGTTEPIAIQFFRRYSAGIRVEELLA